MKYAIKVAFALLNFIFYILKKLPVKNKITYISRQSNNKSEDMIMLEVEIRKIAPDIEQVFLCKMIDKSWAKRFLYCFHMFSQMYHIATSKVVILDTYCICVSMLKQRDELNVIQMWHAIGSLKKFGLSIVGNSEGSSETIIKMFKMHENYDWILTSSNACLNHFTEAFGYDESHMKVLPLPRVDKITDESIKKETAERIYNVYPDLKGKKVVVYAPTFRKGKDITEEINDLAKCFELDEFAFVLKKHPLTDIKSDFAINDDYFTTIEMMYVADYVICDYSAIVFEAAVMRKPLFFYNFDYEEYGVDRDFYIDYMEEMPGIKASNPQIIADAIKNDDYNLKRVSDFADKYIEKQSGCSKELAEFVARLCK